jgi:ABC-type antimicrobial peptide transport system permease subunit
MFKNYFLIAWRNIVRNKVFTIINMLGLTLGICACIIIFLVCRYEFSFDNFHPDKERIYHVGCIEKVGPVDRGYTSRVLPPTAAALKQEIPGIEAAASFYNYEPAITIRSGDGSVHSFQCEIENSGQSSVIITDPEYFSIFKYDWLAGSPSHSLEKPFSVVLSEKKAHQYFGALPLDQIIGKEVIYDDSLRVRVAGIVKDWTENTDFPFADFISWSTIGSSFLHNVYHTDMWGPKKGVRPLWVWAMIKLSKETTAAQIAPQLEPFAKRHWTGTPEYTPSFLLQPLSDVHFNTNYSRDAIRKADLSTLYIMMGIALFILLLAVVNFINLSTALSLKRSKEVGVRKVLGGSRANLVLQFLTETAIVICFAILLAMLLVPPLLGFFHDFVPPGVVFHPFSRENLFFFLLLLLGTSILAGLYPAVGLSSYSPVVSLKGEGGQRGGEKWWLRKALIVFQFSISLIFIISILVIGRQMWYMLRTDIGIKTDAVLNLQTGRSEDLGKLQVLKEKIKQLPDVEKVILEGFPATGPGRSVTLVTLLGSGTEKMKVDAKWANDEFIPFYGIKITAGRNILPSDSLREFVINETCARALGFTQPGKALGHFLRFNEVPIPIVGVVADFHQGSFHELIAPLIIGHFPDAERYLGIRFATTGENVGDLHATLTAIGKIWKGVYPDQEFNYSFLDEQVASMYEDDQKTAKLVRAATLITIFISCLGLFGLVLFTAQRKTKEIAIRKTIGASVANIVTMLCKEFVSLICVAILVASPVAWWVMHRWLDGFAYRLPISWWIFALAGAMAIVLALLTVSFRAIKAALVNPARSLRAD